jgi:NADH-quinone oxidoreductase subunit J
MNLIFYIAAGVAIVSTALAISGKNAIHALLFLILSLLAVSVIFYILGSPFIAALEVIIYAGAVMVLFIFVIMMLNVGMERETERYWLKPAMWIAPVLLSLVLLADFIFMLGKVGSWNASVHVVQPKAVGISLFSTYLLGVEIAGMLLLAGIVGAYHIGRRKKQVMHRYLQGEPKKLPDNAKRM